MLPGPVTLKELQSIPWWNPELIEILNGVKEQQLRHRLRMQPRVDALHALATEEPLCVSVSEGDDLTTQYDAPRQ